MENNVTKHICGTCLDEWLTEDEYNIHTCQKTGYTPQQAEHQGPEFVEIQKAALQRGLETLQADGADGTRVAVQQEAIQQLGGDVPTETPVEQQPIQLN